MFQTGNLLKILDSGKKLSGATHKILKTLVTKLNEKQKDPVYFKSSRLLASFSSSLDGLFVQPIFM